MSKAKQVIVLSHNDALLHELYCAREVRKSRVSYYIGQVEKSSTILPFNIEDPIKGKDHLNKSYKALKNFLASPNLSNKNDCLENIRIALESSIKKKNFTLIENHNKTFTELIKILEENYTIQFRGQYGKSRVIDMLKDLDSVSWSAHHGQACDVDMNWSNLPENISLEELKGYVEDTINLIDHIL